jgi:four helix bundle protein
MAQRRYPAHWVSKLSDSEAESAETQDWLKFAVECGYLKRESGSELHNEYNAIIGMLVNMILHPENWSL